MQQRTKYLVFTAEYLIPALLVVFILAGYLLAFHTRLFTIKQFSCQLDYQVCQQGSLTAELDKVKGINLIRFDSSALESRLLSGDFTIRSVQFTKVLPNTLEVVLLSTYPALAVQEEGVTNKWVTLDERLRIIAVRETDPNITTITVPQLPPFRLGQTVEDSRLLATLKLAKAVDISQIPVSEIRLTGESDVTLQLENGLVAYLTVSKDPGGQLTILQNLLIDSSITKEYHSVDLRYTQPVLK